MGDFWRFPFTRKQAAAERVATAEDRAAEDAQALRRQCLEWAFQTREFSDVPHMNVLHVAQSYYDFIKGARAYPRADQALSLTTAPRQR